MRAPLLGPQVELHLGHNRCVPTWTGDRMRALPLGHATRGEGGRKEADERRSKEKARTQQNKRVERNMFWIDLGSLGPFFEGS